MPEKLKASLRASKCSSVEILVVVQLERDNLAHVFGADHHSAVLVGSVRQLSEARFRTGGLESPDDAVAPDTLNPAVTVENEVGIQGRDR